MSHSYRLLFNTLLRHLDAERAHQLALHVMSVAQRCRPGLKLLARHVPDPDPRLACTRFGLRFTNPLGLAAGMDKEAEVVSALFALGFGHVEVGTVTPRIQSGNPPPRVWRLLEERALINALGFPSGGAIAVRDRLLARTGIANSTLGMSGVLGINLGKNRDTPLEQAPEDYAELLRTLYDCADYFTINLSSPNTPGLRQLQLGEHLSRLLAAVIQLNRQLSAERNAQPKPLLLKVSPDLEDEELRTLAQCALETGMSGIVATNTTIRREALAEPYMGLPGGLSGPPLRARSLAVTRLLFRELGQRLPIVGVGGIATAAHVLEHLRAGASLIQLFTGFVYGGPSTVGGILRELSAAADREKWGSLDELVGR